LKRQFSRKSSNQNNNKKDSQKVIKPKNHEKKVYKKSRKSFNNKDNNNLKIDDDNHSSSNSSSHKETDQIKNERRICRHSSVNYNSKEIKEFIRDIIKKEKESIHLNEMDKKRTEVSNLNHKSRKSKLDLKMEPYDKNLDNNLMRDRKISKRSNGSADDSINNLWERRQSHDDNFGQEEIKELKQL